MPDSPDTRQVRYAERIALVDLLDRVLGGGVVVAGDVTLSIAGVDLVRISLRALVASVAALAESDVAEPAA
jgi:hypothetical protein